MAREELLLSDEFEALMRGAEFRSAVARGISP